MSTAPNPEANFSTGGPPPLPPPGPLTPPTLDKMKASSEVQAWLGWVQAERQRRGRRAKYFAAALAAGLLLLGAAIWLARHDTDDSLATDAQVKNLPAAGQPLPLASGDRDEGDPKTVVPVLVDGGDVDAGEPEKTTAELNLYGKRTQTGRERWIGNYGGSAISEKAVTDGLDWLVRHQAADGCWSNRNLGAGKGTRCKGPSPCSGIGETCEMAHTGLALLALQAGGHYYFNREKHSDAVRKGLDWIVAHQRDDGGLVGSLSQGKKFHQYYMYEHGIAAFALADACAAAAALGEPRQERYFRAVEKAVAFIEKNQHKDGGWRYAPNPNAASDTSVTGWPMLALKSAKEAGVPLHDDVVEKIRAFFLAREMGQDGRTGYDSKHSYGTHATTGVGMLARQFLLHEPDAPLVHDAANYLAGVAEATWANRAPNAGNRDYYLWYNCTLAMFQAGGETWKRWNDIVRDTVVNLQCHEGCAAGSWDPNDKWGSRGGRIYSTALAVLTLEVYYRYTPPEEIRADTTELHPAKESDALPKKTTKSAALTPAVGGQ